MSQIEHLDGVKKYIYNLIYVMIFVSPMLVLDKRKRTFFMDADFIFYSDVYRI